MRKQWQGMDLEGGGLQQVQMAYTARARSLVGAYLRWLLFPLGWHRFYLGEPWGGWAYIAASVAAAAGHWGMAWPWLWLLPAVAAVPDLFWIPGRRLRVNKELRKQVMLSSARPGAPRGFQGHHTEENTTARRPSSSAESDAK